MSVHVYEVTSVVYDSETFQTVAHTRLLCPWDSAGKNTKVSCHDLLQGIFPTQGKIKPTSHISCTSRQVLYH